MYRAILLAFWSAIAVYSFSSTVFGRTGILAERELAAGRDELAENLEVLKTINADLVRSVDALRYDADAVSVYARELGYARADERHVRIAGAPPAVRRTAAAGRLVEPKAPRYAPDVELKAVAACVGAAVFAASLAAAPGRRRRSRRGAAQERGPVEAGGSPSTGS